MSLNKKQAKSNNIKPSIYHFSNDYTHTNFDPVNTVSLPVITNPAIKTYVHAQTNRLHLDPARPIYLKLTLMLQLPIKISINPEHDWSIQAHRQEVRAKDYDRCDQVRPRLSLPVLREAV